MSDGPYRHCVPIEPKPETPDYWGPVAQFRCDDCGDDVWLPWGVVHLVHEGTRHVSARGLCGKIHKVPSDG